MFDIVLMFYASFSFLDCLVRFSWPTHEIVFYEAVFLVIC